MQSLIIGTIASAEDNAELMHEAGINWIRIGISITAPGFPVRRKIGRKKSVRYMQSPIHR